MDSNKSLEASFWFMVLLQTLGSVDMPGSGPRKMPSPRAYLAVIVTWAVLMMIADTGESRARGSAAAGWVIVLTGLVVGPFGTKLSSFFNGVVNAVAGPSQTTTITQNG